LPAQDRRLVYESGDWEMDLAQRELRTRGVPVPIGGRAFEIVEILVQSAGELVTKNDLMGRVWPGTIVEDNTLQFHISAIRKALGPDRGLLKTVSGRGYRLVGTWILRQEDISARLIVWSR
jgi:DNA-binding winged helix-turn-helix (wHTH) protein